MKRRRLFAALLKFWRARRGLSQLALSLESDVSSRHLSFLESGHAMPSEDMVLRLGSVLNVPLRDQNELLTAAGFEARFVERTELPPEIDAALTQMIKQHEPFPILVLGLDGTILRSSEGGRALFAKLLPPMKEPPITDIYSLHFDPKLLRPAVVDWEGLARGMMSRLQREALQRDDERLHARLDQLAKFDGVPDAWRQPDFSDHATTFQVRYEKGKTKVAFLVTATVFLGPRELALEELRIESCFPLDKATRETCERFGSRT
ncbi:MAG: helix-turn-helix domain-containing protein [Archangium sp.]